MRLSDILGKRTNGIFKPWLKWPVLRLQRKSIGSNPASRLWLTMSAVEGNIIGALSVWLLEFLVAEWLIEDTVAPPKYQKFLSYTAGYLCVLGWHASLAGTCYASGQQVQAIIVLANPNYKIHTWQTALLAWAVVVTAIFFNTVMFRKLPIIEGIVMIAHVLGFCAFIVVLWYA